MNQDLLQKLVRLANNNPNENEANLAARRVCKMLAESWDVKPQPDWIKEQFKRSENREKRRRDEEQEQRTKEEQYRRQKNYNPFKNGEYKPFFDDSSSFTQEQYKYMEDFIAEMFGTKGKGK